MSSAESASKRAINVGRKVSLSIGDVAVHEPTLEGIIRVSDSLLAVMHVFTSTSSDAEDADGLSMMAKLVKAPATMVAIKAILAELTRMPVETFTELPLTDFVHILDAAREVVDWEELRDLFTRLIPTSLRTSLNQALKAQIAS